MMKRAPDNVRYLGQFGEDILTRSFTARDPKPTSDLRLVDLFMAGRMPFDRLSARYDFADFNIAAADAISGGVIKPLVLLPQ
jgi:Zn-dependent alcohol dehydrogenase